MYPSNTNNVPFRPKQCTLQLKQPIETGFEAEGYIVCVGRVHFLYQKGTLFVSEEYIILSWKGTLFWVGRVHYFEFEGLVDYSFHHSFKMLSNILVLLQFELDQCYFDFQSYQKLTRFIWNLQDLPRTNRRGHIKLNL